ncbi:MAG: methyl-accepting chemotaxis protein [Myxococcota bacterium]
MVAAYAEHFAEAEKQAQMHQRAVRARIDRELRVVATDVQGMVAELGTIAKDLTDTAAGQSQAMTELVAAASAIRERAVGTSEALRGLADVVSRVESDASESRGCVADTQMLCEGAHTAMSRLHERAQAIDRNVATIDDVASRTRLLALNARIEAARAGESGAGFRVVADEVKHLATASSSASHVIDTDLGEVQDETSTVMECVGEVLSAIGTVASLSQRMSTSVASQGPVAQEVEASIRSTAEAATEISEKARSFGTAAEDTSSKASSIEEVSSRLIHTSARIGDLLSELSF